MGGGSTEITKSSVLPLLFTWYLKAILELEQKDAQLAYHKTT